MAEITATKVKELRERTGAGMMDCKEALKEVEGDFEEAIVYLRKKMGNKLERREGRSTSEGVVATAVAGNVAAIIELNSETDFVAKSDDFKGLAKEIAAQVLQNGGESVEAILAQPSVVQEGATLGSRLQDIFAKLRESLIFKRFERFDAGENGIVAAYVHVAANDKIGVLVELNTPSAESAANPVLQSLGKELAMQVAAARPKYLTREEVPASVLDQERDIARTQAENEGRPAAAMEKIVEGRLKKFFEEVVLLDQAYLREPKKTVGQVVKESGEGVSIRRYVRYEVGELAKSTPAEA
jgi:elongation factor Ts